MKRFYFICSLLLLCVPAAQAQLTDVLTSLASPDGIAVNGNDLYFTEATAGRLSRIDITQENPEITILLSGLENPLALIYSDGDLIYSEENPNRIVRYNIETASSTTLIADTGGEVAGLYLAGDWLYLSQDTRILRADISGATPMLETVATGLLSAQQLGIRDSVLFVCERFRNRLSTVDLTATLPATPTTAISNFFNAAGLLIDGDFLYASNVTRVLRVDLANPAIQILYTGLDASRSIALAGNDLYITQVSNGSPTLGRISKLSVAPAFGALSPVCFGTVPTDLGRVSPSGGVFSGPGVTDNGDGRTFSFNSTEAGAGTTTVTYTIGPATATATIEVKAADDSDCAGAALSFDDSDDFVSIPLTPAAVTGDSVAISGWIKLDATDDAGTEGIMGWRNDTDADFFLLALNSTEMEARFRNSAGQAFTLTSDQLETGVWQHWTLTYDGTELILYRNGAAVERMPASGQLASTGPDFRLGNVVFMDDSFSMNGDLDEVRIWNRGLDCFEASQLYDCELALDQRTGLLGYYQFNQGLFNEDNSSITELTATVGPAGSFNNMSLDGSESNFVGEGGVVTGSICLPLNTSTVSDVTGNGIVVPNGDTNPTVAAGTDFGTTGIGQGVTSAFVLGLNGSLPQPLIAVDNPAFAVSPINSDGTFTVTFTPTAVGEETATVSIAVADCTIDYIYRFAIKGNGIVLPGAALDFNESNSFVTVPVTPADLTGTGLTISGWVRAEDIGQGLFQNTGLFGWSNGMNSDFFLGQRGVNCITMNFRNGDGQLFTTTACFLTPGTWQHLALTYDGSTLALYVNGRLRTSRAANGTLGATDVNFLMGSTALGGADFHYGGELDNIAIWDRALDCNEIISYLECELSGQEAGLLAYYPFNQGLGGLDNTDISVLTATVGADATLQNFALTGLNGNFVAPGAVPSGVSCAPVEAPSITVNNAGTPIANGDATPATEDGTDLGVVVVGTRDSAVFDIELTGNLTIPAISDNDVEFSLARSGDSLLTVFFSPLAPGPQVAFITIDASNCDTTIVFTFAVGGTGELPPAPDNDACADASDIGALFGQPFNEPQVSEQWNNASATTDSSDPFDASCYFQGDTLSRTVWYTFTGDGNTYAIRSVQCGDSPPSLDTQVAVFSGDCDDLTPVTCNDDSADGVNFRVEIPTAPGTTYRVMVDGFRTTLGAFCLEVTNLTEPMLPGENCATGIGIDSLLGQTPLVAQYSTLYDNTDYGTDDTDPAPDEMNCDLIFTNTIWYSFTGDGNTYSLRSADCDGTSTNLDLSAHLYTGNCDTLTQVACNDDDTSDDPSNNGFGIEIATEVGVTYYLVVDEVFPDQTGTFCLEITNLTTTGVADLASVDLRVYPNPTTGLLQLPPVAWARVEVYDATGRLVASHSRPGPAIRLDRQSAGLYFLKLYADESVYSVRVIKR